MKKLILIPLLFAAVICLGQGGQLGFPLLTPTGAVVSFNPNINYTSASFTETSLLGTVKDTIKARTLVPNRPYRFEMYCVVTTPTLSLPTLALKVKLGNQVVAMVNSTSVLGGLTNAGLRIRGVILATSSTSQTVLCEVIQPNGGILSIGNSNANFYTVLTVDMTQNQILDITAQWGGLTGTAAIKSVLYYRPDF